MSTSKFFHNRKSWSGRKHRLLRNYVEPFTAKVAKTTRDRRIFIVDGFAGQARYDDGTKGSPLVIAEFADIALSWGNPVSLKLINVEPSTNTFDFLSEATDALVKKGIVTNLNGEFQELLPKIYSIIGTSPTLFFIDPYGPTYVHFEHLLPLLKRSNGITELIINFDTDGLYRIACGALSARTDPKTAETFATLVTQIVGSDRWQTVLSKEALTTEEGEEFLLNEYLSNLRKYMEFVFAYPIRESLDARPKYYFVFCTRHSHGLTLMNDFVRHEDDLIYGEHIESASPLFHSLNLGAQAIAARRTALKSILLDYLQKNDPIIRAEMIEMLVPQTFGLYDGKDYRAVFKELIDSGYLATDDGKTKIDFRKYRFIRR